MLRMAHKEERFLFVIYPLICLTSSITIQCSVEASTVILRKLGFSGKVRIYNGVDELKTAGGDVLQDRRSFEEFIPHFIRFIVGLSHRQVNARFIFPPTHLISNGVNYSAPFFLYSKFESLPTANTSTAVNVCVAKEWYRFPSHFFVPPNHTLRFVRSGFGGQLPALYNETYSTHGFPPHFNDMNREETERYVRRFI